MNTSRVLLAVLISAAASAAAQAGERLGPSGPARLCSRHGTGFVEVPGTGTCIRIGGRARTEYGIAGRRVSRDDIVGFKTSGTASVESRTDSAYGPVRTYVRLRAGQDAGRP